MDSIVDSCVSSLEDILIHDESTVNGEIDYGTSYSSGANVDNIVNILIQDLSECTTGTVSDTDMATKIIDTDSKVQLWVD